MKRQLIESHNTNRCISDLASSETIPPNRECEQKPKPLQLQEDSITQKNMLLYTDDIVAGMCSYGYTEW